MPKPRLLKADASYTFRSYFELQSDVDEVLAEFDCGYQQQRLTLPRSNRPIEGLADLREQLESILPYVRLNSEQAKREVLVAPVMLRVALICQQILRIEYPVKINEQLQGNLDYLIQSDRGLVVVEAKRDNLTRGFTQLSVEMIALSMLHDTLDEIYGAVTMGTLWVFGVLDRHAQTITQDIGSYTLPDDLETLVRILVGILE